MNCLPHNALMLSVLLSVSLFSGAVMALEPDECSNDAVPRSTPSSDFVVMEEGSVVRHKATGLDWQRCPLGKSWDGDACTGSASTFTWQDALEEADSVSGWRLPNINELTSIVEECRSGPAINRQAFPDTDPFNFWSSSPDAGYPGMGLITNAWVLRFDAGNDLLRAMEYTYRIRLVRDGQ